MPFSMGIVVVGLTGGSWCVDAELVADQQGVCAYAFV